LRGRFVTSQISHRPPDWTQSVKTLTTAIVMSLLTALPLQAEVYDAFVVQLRDQGYSEITVGYTWLGRIVINAQRDTITREVVLNARTGEILGDHASEIAAAALPKYTNSEGSDHNDPPPPAAIEAPMPDPMAAVAGMADERTILDSGDVAGGTD
jgi:hypothetical protein